jgi:hypothetical protein
MSLACFSSIAFCWFCTFCIADMISRFSPPFVAKMRASDFQQVL